MEARIIDIGEYRRKREEEVYRRVQQRLENADYEEPGLDLHEKYDHE